MTRYVVTGPVVLGLPPARHRAINVVANAITALDDVDVFTTGGAHGIDTIAALLAWSAHPDAYHRVVLPDQPYHPLWDNPPSGFSITRVPGGYMARNDALVTYGDVLLAFPKSATERLRSGTWATIRRARKAGLDIRLEVLS